MDLVIRGNDMHKMILRLLILTALVLAAGGCIGNEGSGTNTSSGNNESMITVSSLRDINRALEDGPVLVEIGYDGCPACKAQKPIMEEIAAEYKGRASVMYIDTKKVGVLGFSVSYVPDSFVITGIEDQQYVYMRLDGQATTNREEARFTGLTRKAVLTQTLDHALTERNGTSP